MARKVRRLEASGTSKASLASARAMPGGGQNGNNEGQTIRYGSGSANEETFYYIREGILKNVRYPENARKRVWKGKSFFRLLRKMGQRVM